MPLLLSPALKSKQRQLLLSTATGLPFEIGSPVFISAAPLLTAYRGKLLSREPGLGTPVYAGTFVRQRKIVLESSLFADTDLLRLVFAHELFHFLWPHLGNALRRSYSDLLQTELAARARGELGESSEIRKTLAATNPRNWRNYVCESFCDTGAHLYAGVATHSWFQLAARWRKKRAAWFYSNLER